MSQTPRAAASASRERAERTRPSAALARGRADGPYRIETAAAIGASMPADGVASPRGPRISCFEPLDRGIDREPQPRFVEERAGDQATGSEHPPEGVEQHGIGRYRRPPEIVELA